MLLKKSESNSIMESKLESWELHTSWLKTEQWTMFLLEQFSMLQRKKT